MKKPSSNDYSPYYAGYISLIPDNVNILETLQNQKDEFFSLIKSIPGEMADFSYGPNKWTIKEVLGHLIDTERIQAFRVLCISRGEKQNLPGFSQDDYVREGKFDKRDLIELAEEYTKLREVNLLLFKSLDEITLEKRGIANNSEVTVKSLLYIIAGHQLHHLKVLKEKYLQK
jgi:uncharacterized damage-inducible protein DinB